MVSRGEGADPSRDVGTWKHVEDKHPYVTWEKDIGRDKKAQMLVGDTGPRSDDEYWAHVEVLERAQGGGWTEDYWAEEPKIAADGHSVIVDRAKEWMRRNQDWPDGGGSGGDDPLGMGELSLGFGHSADGTRDQGWF